LGGEQFVIMLAPHRAIAPLTTILADANSRHHRASSSSELARIDRPMRALVMTMKSCT